MSTYNGSIDTSILDIGLNSSPVHTYKIEINAVFIFIDIKIKTDESYLIVRYSILLYCSFFKLIIYLIFCVTNMLHSFFFYWLYCLYYRTFLLAIKIHQLVILVMLQCR